MNQNTDINKMSILELKALAYDVGVVYEQSRHNLGVINKKIEELSVEPVDPKEGKKDAV